MWSNARRLMCAAAAVAGLGSMMWAAPLASAGSPPSPPPGAVISPHGPKLEGQLKNGFNHLCLDDGKELYSRHPVKLNRPVTLQRCRTVNGGYTSASQYFFLEARFGGFQFHTLWSNICVGRRLHGYPTPGDNLMTMKCNANDARQLFAYVGGEDKVPFYFNAKYYDAKHREYRSTAYTAGTRTRSVGAFVGVDRSGRVSYTAWHGTLAGAH